MHSQKVYREIQGLRAFSVLLVLIHHIFPNQLPGGFVGVDVFFVISGYLITLLLLKEIDSTGSVNILKFYTRRFRRLIPAASIVLFAAALFYKLLPNITWPDLSKELLSSTFYFQNWWLAEQSIDYFSMESAPSPLQHYWSLSVEEQYYLFWPLVMCSVALWGGGSKKALGVIVMLIGGASLAYSIYLSEKVPEYAYFSTFTRAWEFSVGGLLAIFPSWRGVSLIARRILGWLGILAITLSAFLYTSGTEFPGSWALFPTIGAALVIVSGKDKALCSLFSIMSSRLMQYMGGISYSLYLWHWPVIIYAGYIAGGANVFVKNSIVVAISFCLAHITKYQVEDFFRSNALTFNKKDGAVCLAIFSVLLFSLWINTEVSKMALPINQTVNKAVIENDPDNPISARFDRVENDGSRCFASGLNSQPLVCRYGNPSAKKIVAIVGDSHARHWVPALRVIAERENFRLFAITKSGCAFGFVLNDKHKLQKRISCAKWNNNIKPLLKSIDPDVYIFSQSVASNYLDGLSREENVNHLSDFLVAEWAAILESGTPVIAIGDTPNMGKDIPLCLTNNRENERDQPCSTSRKKAIGDSAVNDPVVVAASKSDGVLFVDMTDFICDDEVCPAIKNGVVVWRDRHHLTASFSRRLAPELHLAISESFDLE